MIVVAGRALRKGPIPRSSRSSQYTQGVASRLRFAANKLSMSTFAASLGSDVAEGGRFKSMNWGENAGRVKKVGELSAVTFNMLAPCYKRLAERDLLGRNRREADVDWRERADETLTFFEGQLLQDFQIVSLQEFWLQDEYQKQFKRLVSRLGYSLHTLRRHPTRKEDAVATMVQTSVFHVKSYDNIFLCSTSDRVALVLWLEHRETKKNIIVANTHLSFPHSARDMDNQMSQMKFLLQAIDNFATSKCGCPEATRIVMGDFNVESSSEVCDLLRLGGYRSCIDTSPPPIVRGDDKVSRRFVSHRTHRHEDLGVDHIFFKPETFPLSADEGIARKHGSFFAADSVVLPQTSPCTAWDENFSISDHRPVGTKLIIGQQKDL